MKLILVFVVFLLLTGCGGIASDHESSGSENILSEENRRAIEEIAAMEKHLYELSELTVDNSAVEIRLALNFTPLAHEEVMIFTDPFAAEVAEMFDHEKAVYVAAVHDIEGIGENRVFGESIFSPQSGKVTYRHFGRDHDLRHGDP